MPHGHVPQASRKYTFAVKREPNRSCPTAFECTPVPGRSSPLPAAGVAGQVGSLQKQVDAKAQAVIQAENGQKQLQRMLNTAREKEASLTKRLREQEAATAKAEAERDAMALRLQGARSGDKAKSAGTKPQPLKLEKQKRKECGVMALRQTLAHAVPADKLGPVEHTWGRQLEQVSRDLTAQDKALEKMVTDDDKPHKAVEYSDAEGNILIQVLTHLVEVFYPWLALTPSTQDEQPGWETLNSFLRHYGPAMDGHYVHEGEDPTVAQRGTFRRVCSLGPTVTSIPSGLCLKETPRKWRLRRRKWDSYEAMADGELRQLASALGMPAASVINPSAGGQPRVDVLDWVQATLRPMYAYDPW
eukprot:gene10301-66_t